MPIINIETVQSVNSSVKKEILKDIHRATAEVLQIPANACHVRWIEINKDDYFCVSDNTSNHIFVEIKLFSGRSIEIKKRLYQSIFTAIRNQNIETKDLMIALCEIPMENWGMHGGIPSSELALDYKVNI